MKPSIPRGTRDFGHTEMKKRQYIFNIIKSNFHLFGFEAIETPAMENITTLTGKYGEEGDQLIYKILNSRIHESKSKDVLKQEFDLSLEGSRNSEALTEKALRYDLTVPFARYVAMNHHQLTFPFKRYQMQPVWRADRPQKGRYREFYQCDADVVGSNSLVNELELISLMDKIFSELKVRIKLKVNNRKILSAIAEKINQQDKIIDITVAIDKVDKIGLAGVNKELLEKGIPQSAIDLLQDLFTNVGDSRQKIEFLKNYLSESEIGNQGIKELEYFFENEYVLNLSSYAELELDITLARGLNYYTGTIFEIKANEGSLTSSIAGGGRYDNLTGIFGLPNVSGVGISFGIDRIYDVMEELNLFPEEIVNSAICKVMFVHFDEASQQHCLELARQLRENKIACEVYPDLNKKLGKQFEYADKKKIPFVCTVGSNEMQEKMYALKNLKTGEQKKLSLQEIIEILK